MNQHTRSETTTVYETEWPGIYVDARVYESPDGQASIRLSASIEISPREAHALAQQLAAAVIAVLRPT